MTNFQTKSGKNVYEKGKVASRLTYFQVENSSSQKREKKRSKQVRELCVSQIEFLLHGRLENNCRQESYTRNQI